jgi:hypothetical protein
VRIPRQIGLCPAKVGGRVTGKRETQRMLQPYVDRVNFPLAVLARENKSSTLEAFVETDRCWRYAAFDLCDRGGRPLSRKRSAICGGDQPDLGCGTRAEVCGCSSPEAKATPPNKEEGPVFRSQRCCKNHCGSQGEQRVFYWLAAATGLRAGEIVGLRTTALEGERLTVSQSVWHGKVQSPKTDNAVRTLAVSPQLVTLLWE